MDEYTYTGPVVKIDIFGNELVLDHMFKATTYAESEKKAKNNLAYRYKRTHGLPMAARLKFPGTFTVEY